MIPEEPHDEDPDIALLSVLRDDGSVDPATDPELSAETVMKGYREMRRVRALDARMILLLRQGRVGFYDAAQGLEAVPIGAGLAVGADDWVFPAVREQSVMLIRGGSLRDFVAQVFGTAGDAQKGRQMPGHQASRAVHHVSGSSCVGSQLPQAVGAAWAMRARRSPAVAVAFCGDGATSQADFHVAMNFAGVWRVPCVLVCHNPHGSIGVAAEKPTASGTMRTIAVKARAYGIPGVRVDGSDLLAVVRVMTDALDRARSGGGPTFVEAVTRRTGARSTNDDPTRDGSDAQVDSSAHDDPLERLRRYLVRLGLVSDASDAELDAQLAAEIADAIEAVEARPPLEGGSLVEDVYAEPPWNLREQQVELQNARRRSRHE